MEKTNVFSTQEIVKTGFLAALVFVGTYFFKIPAPFGYTHLGDCMILVSVYFLGTKKGALASAIGAGLADLLGGYVVWVAPTFMIKGSWAIIMGLIASKLFTVNKYRYLIGAVVGGIIQIVLYTLVKIPLFGFSYAISTVPALTAQTACGIVFGIILIHALSSSLKNRNNNFV